MPVKSRGNKILFGAPAVGASPGQAAIWRFAFSGQPQDAEKVEVIIFGVGSYIIHFTTDPGSVAAYSSGGPSAQEFNQTILIGATLADTMTALAQAVLDWGVAVFNFSGPNLTATAFSDHVDVNFSIDLVANNGGLISSGPFDPGGNIYADCPECTCSNPQVGAPPSGGSYVDPDNATGGEGDVFIHTVTGNLYQKTGGAWVRKAQVTPV